MIAIAKKRIWDGIGHLTLTSRLAKSRFLDSYSPKVRLAYETDRYFVKTAEDANEIDEALKLRHRVFLQELQGKRKVFRIELDRLDLACDHLLIIDKETLRAVGTYRLLSSLYFDRFYSEGEFELDGVKELPGTKLELGRACIDSDHRSGAVIQLLWRGITAYMKKTDTRWLMGCSSIQTLDPRVIHATAMTLREQGHADGSLGIYPKKGYRPDEFGIDLTTAAGGESPREMPPLLLSYLKAGAKVGPTPAVDRDFQCIDFFTLLDREGLPPSYRRRYFGE
jgi:putative hemolysin